MISTLMGSNGLHVWVFMYVLRTGAHRENEVWTLVYLNEGEASFKLFENADLVRTLANSLNIFFISYAVLLYSSGSCGSTESS